MSIFPKLAQSKWLKVAVVGFFVASCTLTALAMFYVRFHYQAVMPRSPQPATGRIYPVGAQYTVVYVNKAEREFTSFVEYVMPVVAIAAGTLSFFLGTHLGWFKKKPPWDSPDSSAGGDGA